MLKSSIHKNKQIVSVSEVITMIQDQNWKKDVSYLLIEQTNGDKWKETGLIPMSQAHDLKWYSDNGHLIFYTDDLRVDLKPVTEGTLVQELIDPDDADNRYTIYMT